MTLDDLMRVDGKAELIDGRIVCFPPMGWKPGRIASRIIRSLYDHAGARCSPAPSFSPSPG